MKNNSFTWFSILFASLGGILAGFDTGVISGVLLYIKNTFSLSSELLGFLVSAVSIGAVFGALINGRLIDKFGRKKVLLLSSLVFILGSIFSSLAQSVAQLVLSRIFVGCAIGIVSFAAPLYLSEVSSKEKRGANVSFYQISITFGILLSYLVNYFCSTSIHSWRLMLFVGFFPAFIMFLGLLFLMDTPRWYVLKGKISKAKDALYSLGFNDVDANIDEIKNTLNQEEKIIFNKKVLKPFVIGIGIMFVQIVTGINAIIYYAPTIFKSIGFASNQDVLLITIFIGAINFLMTFVAVALVDKIGRKPLLYIGLFGMLISLIMLSLVYVLDFAFVKYLSIIFCAIYIVSFSMSLGPVALLIIAEVFPLKYRGQAMSIAIISNFIFNFIVTAFFPVAMNKIGGAAVFALFAFICIISLFFVRFVVPETKNLTLEEIEKSI